jgi:hypothetical protein
VTKNGASESAATLAKVTALAGVLS